MVDVFKTLDIDYLAMNCASSFPRTARGHTQLRRQYQTRNPHLSARRNRGSHGAGLRQDRGQADGHDLPRRGWPAACHMAMYNAWCDRVPVIVMGRQYHRSQQARAGRRMGALGDRPGAIARDFVKWDDQPDLASAFRRIGGARLQGRDHSADGAGDAVARCRTAGKSDRRRRKRLRIPKLLKVVPPQGDSGALAELCENAGRCRKSRDHLRSPSPHAGRHDANGRVGRDTAMRSHRQRRPHEFPFASSAQHVIPSRHHRASRCHSGDGSE